MAAGTRIQGNYIGTDASGTAVLGGSSRAILITGSNNTIGGTTDGARAWARSKLPAAAD